VTPGPPEIVTGAERLGWTQTTADTRELSTFRYAIYVDGARAELTGVTCRPPSSPTSADFECSAPLPAMATGRHTLELATFIVDGTVLESARSASLQVNKTSAAATEAPGPAAWPSGMTVATADGLRLRIDRIAEGLINPVDIAFVPDGRMLIAEEPGSVRVLLPDGQMLAEPALSRRRARSDATRLVALAVDPGFARTHFVYAVYTAPSPAGRLVFTLARFREASNALIDRIVLLDDIPAAPRSAASLRGSSDGKVFVAFDDGDDSRRGGDLASPNGKILRLNPDGTTPDDQAGLTPTFASDFHSPRGFDWRANVLWIADRDSVNSARLSAIAASSESGKRGVRLASYALPRGTLPSSVAVYRGALIPTFRNDLMIASEEGQHLLRVRFDSVEPTKVVGTERLLQNAIGGIRVVAVSPDGAIYLATADQLARVNPAE
jgi:glucose/arabinose dehydrogenase